MRLLALLAALLTLSALACVPGHLPMAYLLLLAAWPTGVWALHLHERAAMARIGAQE